MPKLRPHFALPVEYLLHHQPHAMLCIAALLALPLVLGACYDDCEKSGSNLLQSHARRVEPKCLGLVILGTSESNGLFMYSLLYFFCFKMTTAYPIFTYTQASWSCYCFCRPKVVASENDSKMGRRGHDSGCSGCHCMGDGRNVADVAKWG